MENNELVVIKESQNIEKTKQKKNRQQGQQSASFLNQIEDQTKNELKILQKAAKRANEIQLTIEQPSNNATITTNANVKDIESSLPQIEIQDKRKMLNQMGLKKINKIRNVQSLMKKIRQESNQNQ